MKYIFFVCLWIVSSFIAVGGNSQKENIVVSLMKKGARISPSMYGAFFEEINHAGDGGLYAELVQNRSFEDAEIPVGYYVNNKNRLVSPYGKNHLTGKVYNKEFSWYKEPVRGWYLDMKDSLAACMELTKDSPMFESAPHNLKVTITDASLPVSLVNEGYWGMGIRAGENYRLRVIVRTDGHYQGTVSAKIVARNGNVLASSLLEIVQNGWNDIETLMTAEASDSEARLVLEFDAPGNLWFDYVSLFPENTFNNRPNGMRRDVAEMLVGLRPAFFRWPGGCVVEGITLNNRFDWKKTLGDPAARSGEYSMWGYRCSYGMGYYEVLQFCEDIGAKAMYVCNIGMDCELRLANVCPEDSVAFFLEDCLDAIEYAIGDSSTEWGARRAADGHPEPFPLQYVEIGNENWGPVYEKRFNLFYKTIKEKYPQLTLIYNIMRKRECGPIPQTDMIDPHWYVAPDFFFKNSRLFDDWERGKYEIYVGEYACNREVGSGNMTAALSEAAFIGGMERNGDLVTMASYAPLFENSNDRQWRANLIWIDSDRVMGRSSYYVQKMAAENRPTYNVWNSVEVAAIDTVNQMTDNDLLRDCPLWFVNSGYDETTGELIIKVVNASKQNYYTTVLLDGAENVGREGRVISLVASDGEDENTFEEPMKIYPREIIYGKFGKCFDYTFEPFSYTILRIKATM